VAWRYALAFECAAAALSKDPGLTWIALIQAHAQMFLGRTEETRSFYRGFRGKKDGAITHWENLILQDFAEFRKRDQIVPLMAELEASLREQGWSTAGLYRKAGPGSGPAGMLPHEQEFTRLNPRHLETAAIYVNHRKFDEAAEIYRYLIRKDRAAIGEGSETRTGDLELAEIHFSQLVQILLFEGSFGFALECIAELSPQTMARLPVQATYAHLLLMSNRVPEAEAIYQRHRGKAIGGKVWELAMLEDLQQLRARGRSTHASLRLEKQFEEGKIAPSMVARAESDGPPLRLSRPANPKEPTLSERSDLRAGEELFGAGEIDDALAVYRRLLASTAQRFADGILTGQQRAERQEAAEWMADIAFCYLLEGKAELARDVCSEAQQAVPGAAKASIRQAHALMLLGNAPAAKAIYQKHLNGFAAPNRPWATVLIEEFQQLRNAGFQHPLMAEIEAMLQQRNQRGIGKLVR
jgi:tetratricopeptide (TPR) repeat protein